MKILKSISHINNSHINNSHINKRIRLNNEGVSCKKDLLKIVGFTKDGDLIVKKFHGNNSYVLYKDRFNSVVLVYSEYEVKRMSLYPLTNRKLDKHTILEKYEQPYNKKTARRNKKVTK